MSISFSPFFVVPYIGTWIETGLIRMTGCKHLVVPYIGTWIETSSDEPVVSGLCRTLYRYVD